MGYKWFSISPPNNHKGSERLMSWVRNFRNFASSRDVRDSLLQQFAYCERLFDQSNLCLYLFPQVATNSVMGFRFLLLIISLVTLSRAKGKQKHNQSVLLHVEYYW